MKTSIVIITIAILLALMVGSVCGQDITAVGTYNDNNTQVVVSDTTIQFSDLKSGISISSSAKIDGLEDNSIISTSPSIERQLTKLIFSDATPSEEVHFSYVLSPNVLKETVVLDAHHDLSFPIAIPAGYKLIPINGGDWRISYVLGVAQ